MRTEIDQACTAIEQDAQDNEWTLREALDEWLSRLDRMLAYLPPKNEREIVEHNELTFIRKIVKARVELIIKADAKSDAQWARVVCTNRLGSKE